MRKRKSILPVMLLTAVLLPLMMTAQLQTRSFAQLDSLQQAEQKHTVVFIYTDWCRYCQAMKSTTLKDRKVIKLLNEHFLFAELNAEEKQDIAFSGQVFRYKPSGSNTGIHELAVQLGTKDGETAWPALCILNTRNEIIFQHTQFLSAADLLQVLQEVRKNP